MPSAAKSGKILLAAFGGVSCKLTKSMFCFQPLSALKKLPLTLNSKSAYKPGPSIRDLRD
jgi:hypothetical protein